MISFKRIIKIIFVFFKIFFITFFLILIIDFFIGNKILQFIDPLIKETEFYDKRVKIWNNTFHHTFKKNVNMKSVGIEKNNRFCTNHLGFKSDCNFKEVNNFKFGFLGDSFTEGIGLNHENTFVGLFEKKLGAQVANMGVSSYSPKIHLSKINFFLNKGISFEHVILFLDISDYFDEANYKFNQAELSVEHNKKELKRIWARENFPFTNYYFYVLKKIRKSPNTEEIKIDTNKEIIFDNSVMIKTSWLNEDIEKYKIKEKTLLNIHSETKYYVDQIYQILKKKDIKFSLAIYPWPQNYLNRKNNVFYREEWKNFCISRCINFFDYFEDFDNLIKEEGYDQVYKKYYIYKDVHFNKFGNILIADKIIKALIRQNER